jgi:hypothetical protein
MEINALLKEYEDINREDFITKITDKKLIALINNLCEFWVTTENYVASSKFSHNIWYSYEYKIWNLGENIRLLLKKRKDIRNSDFLQKEINKIISDKKFGKGREPFALLPGEYKFFSNIETLIKMINDEEIQGHIIISLIKLKVKGLDKEMKVIADTKTGWVSKEAKKYLNKFL